jgi:HKD family nuclease
MFTNRNSKKDFVINGFNQLSKEACHISIATAFFTDIKPLKDMIVRGCKIRMVVRLGFPTSTTALRECLKLECCLVRFVTDKSFHPKIYIFGDNGAIVGSANLTNAALWTNQEVALKVESSDERFDELKSLFEEYWAQSFVLTNEILDIYDKTVSEFENKIVAEADRMNSMILEKIGKVSIVNNKVLKTNSEYLLRLQKNQKL